MSKEAYSVILGPVCCQPNYFLSSCLFGLKLGRTVCKIFTHVTQKKNFAFLHVVDQQRTMLYEGHVIYCT
jgi:hypothetical protein